MCTECKGRHRDDCKKEYSIFRREWRPSTIMTGLVRIAVLCGVEARRICRPVGAARLTDAGILSNALLAFGPIGLAMWLLGPDRKLRWVDETLHRIRVIGNPVETLYSALLRIVKIRRMQEALGGTELIRPRSKSLARLLVNSSIQLHWRFAPSSVGYKRQGGSMWEHLQNAEGSVLLPEVESTEGVTLETALSTIHHGNLKTAVLILVTIVSILATILSIQYGVGDTTPTMSYNINGFVAFLYLWAIAVGCCRLVSFSYSKEGTEWFVRTALKAEHSGELVLEQQTKQNEERVPGLKTMLIITDTRGRKKLSRTSTRKSVRNRDTSFSNRDGLSMSAISGGESSQGMHSNTQILDSIVAVGEDSDSDYGNADAGPNLRLNAHNHTREETIRSNLTNNEDMKKLYTIVQVPNANGTLMTWFRVPVFETPQGLLEARFVECSQGAEVTPEQIILRRATINTFSVTTLSNILLGFVAWSIVALSCTIAFLFAYSQCPLGFGCKSLSTMLMLCGWSLSAICGLLVMICRKNSKQQIGESVLYTGLHGKQAYAVIVRDAAAVIMCLGVILYMCIVISDAWSRGVCPTNLGGNVCDRDILSLPHGYCLSPLGCETGRAPNTTNKVEWKCVG